MNPNDTMPEAADSGETSEKSPTHGAAPDAAFRRAMIGVQTRARALAASIEHHDFEGVEHIACEATSMWLTGRVAYRRLVERTRAMSPLADAARRLLEANYMALLELFTRAAETIAVPRMRRTLHDLRGMLVAAIAQPLSAPAGIDPSRASRRTP